jgi:hypothetical protein
MNPTNEKQNIEQASPQEIEPHTEQGPPGEVAGLAEGRIVHFVLEDGSHRPAVVVRNWHEASGSCNLQVFLDGLNDKASGPSASECEGGIAWRTSVYCAAEPKPGTWHWTEKT